MITRISSLLLTLGFFCCVWGQVSISPGGTYSQNFNSIGTTATASLPDGWVCEKNTLARSVTVAYSTLTTTTTQNVLAYNVAMSNSATNGLWNFGGGASSGDQSVGGISSGSASKSVNYFLKLDNSSSTASIPSFSISYNVERYRNGSNTVGFSVRMYYSTSGLANSWTEITSAIASFAANNDNNGASSNPLQVISISNVTLAQSLSANSSIYFAWSYSVTSGTTTSNAQALGVDDVVITAGCSTGFYTGATGGDWSLSSNWCGGSAPTNTTDVVIPANTTVYLDEAATTVANLTIDGTLVVEAGKQLTVTGALTNNGTLLLQDGATFVQGTSGTSIAGSGTFTVEKALSGNSSTWSSTSGRFWYMGVPMVNVARSSFGSYDAGTNRLWSYAEATKLYTDITDNATTLSAGTGYVHRRSADGSLTFSASGLDGLYRSDASLTGLSRTAGASAGYHLISNPYMAYIDWDAVIAANGTSNIESTYYIRSAEPSNNNALISYNSNGPNYVSGGVASIDQIEDVRYIAPMQSIWVRVGTASATGSLAMSRSMLSHQSNNPGLKNTSIFPTSARVNLVDGGRFDQILVFMNQDMSNGVDQFDSEKMFVNGAPQIYTMAAGKKLVMNGLKNNKKKISVPLYLELPESKVYNLQLTEYILEDGLILLEDKQEGTIQDFSINAIYAFYANSGLLQNRFVLHFIAPDNGIGAQGPNNNWVAEETSYVEGGDILISSDSKGKVQVTLDQPLAENVTGMVQATDVNGKIVFSGQLEGILTEFQMNVPSGIYYLSVQNGSIIQNKKVFVQN